MKKLLSLIVMIAFLAACGGASNEKKSEDTQKVMDEAGDLAEETIDEVESSTNEIMDAVDSVANDAAEEMKETTN